MAAPLHDQVLSELVSMGYPESYIGRALKIHHKSKFGTNYNVSLLVEIIARLKAKDQQKHSAKHRKKANVSNDPNQHNIPKRPPAPFRAHFPSSQSAVNYLATNDLIDYRYANGRYILCRIVDRSGSQIRVHPASLPPSNRKHDEWCSVDLQFHRLAVARSVTLRPLSASPPQHPLRGLQCDELIDVNPRHRRGHDGWKHGQIIKREGHSGQIKVLYFHRNEHHSLWVHFENVDEAAPFNSRYDPLSHGPMAHFSEFQDGRSLNRLKRITSIDAIGNDDGDGGDGVDGDDDGGHDDGDDIGVQNQSEIRGQLLRFGYTEEEIAAAMLAVNDPLDINGIVEWIESKEYGQSVDAQQQAVVNENGQDI